MLAKFDISQSFYDEKIALSSGRYVKHFTIGDLYRLKLENYFSFVFLLCSKPFDIAPILYENGYDYESFTHYDIFNTIFIQSLENIEFMSFVNEFFLTENISPAINEKTKEIFYVDNKNREEIIVNKDNFDEIFNVFSSLIYHNNKKEEKFKTKIAKEMYLENELDEIKFSKDSPKILFSSLLASVVLNTSYTYDSLLRMNLAQFFTTVERSIKRENAVSIKQGIYAGSIDGKKINIKDYNWLL
jgi:hypothetical protein